MRLPDVVLLDTFSRLPIGGWESGGRPSTVALFAALGESRISIADIDEKRAFI
jgi:hypothetical protein